jgi:lysophospholipase L1-like esterase
MSIQLLTPNDQVGYEFLNFLQKSANLFNKSTITAGYYMQNGGLNANEDFWVSDYIPVTAALQYTRSYKADKYLNWFNSAQQFIGGAHANATLTAPTGAAFIRLSCRYQEFTPETFMFVQAATLPSTYVPYYSHVNNLLNIETLCQQVMTRWWGKKLAVLGDSITYGYVPRNNQLTFGTISTSGVNVTGNGTTFTEDMEGYPIICEGETRTIATYVSATSITISSAFSANKSGKPYTVQYNNGYGGMLYSYAVWLAKILNMTLYNYGISGTLLGMKNSGATNTMEQRYTSMIGDADLIIVMGGTNDIRTTNDMPLGTMADRTEYTWYGALHRLCQGLINKYYLNQGLEIGRKKQIVFSTVLHNGPTYDYAYVGGTFKQFAEAEKIVCAYYGIPVYDLMSESGIVPHEFKTVQGWQDGYTALYNPMIPDGTHPTELAHKMIADKMAQFIRAL